MSSKPQFFWSFKRLGTGTDLLVSLFENYVRFLYRNTSHAVWSSLKLSSSSRAHDRPKLWCDLLLRSCKDECNGSEQQAAPNHGDEHEHGSKMPTLLHYEFVICLLSFSKPRKSPISDLGSLAIVMFCVSHVHVNTSEENVPSPHLPNSKK